MKKIIFILIIVFAAAENYGQPQIKTFLEKTNLKYSETNNLHIVITSKQKTPKIYFPNFQEEIITDLPILKITRDTSDTPNQYKIEETIRFLVLQQDTTVKIPPLQIIYENDTLYTDTLKMKIEPYIIDKKIIQKLSDATDSNNTILSKINIDTPLTLNQFWKKHKKIFITSNKPLLFPIKDIFNVPCTFKEFWHRYRLWIFILLILIISTLIFRRLYLKIKEKQNVKKIPQEQVKPHIWAEKELKKLIEQGLYQKGQLKEFYFQLSWIIRRYIELQYNIDILEYTTNEIINFLNATKIIDNEILTKIKSILTTADLVKFAKYKPNEYTQKTNIDYAFEIINKTKPQQTKPEQIEQQTEKNTQNSKQ